MYLHLFPRSWTRTDTHTYIYIYIYICFCFYLGNIDECKWSGPLSLLSMCSNLGNSNMHIYSACVSSMCYVLLLFVYWSYGCSARDSSQECSRKLCSDVRNMLDNLCISCKTSPQKCEFLQYWTNWCPNFVNKALGQPLAAAGWCGRFGGVVSGGEFVGYDRVGDSEGTPEASKYSRFEPYKGTPKKITGGGDVPVTKPLVTAEKKPDNS